MYRFFIVSGSYILVYFYRIQSIYLVLDLSYTTPYICHIIGYSESNLYHLHRHCSHVSQAFFAVYQNLEFFNFLDCKFEISFLNNLNLKQFIWIICPAFGFFTDIPLSWSNLVVTILNFDANSKQFSPSFTIYFWSVFLGFM